MKKGKHTSPFLSLINNIVRNTRGDHRTSIPADKPRHTSAYDKYLNALFAERLQYVMGTPELDLFIQRGLNLKYTITDKIESSPLILAVKSLSRNKLVEGLLEKGADIHSTDKIGRTALYYAVKSNDFKMVKYLVEKGADVNGMLDAAVDYRCGIQYFELFIKYGALVTRDILEKFLESDQNDYRIAALLYQKSREQKICIRIKKHIRAVFENNCTIIRKILNRRIRPGHTLGRECREMLYTAAGIGNMDAVRCFFDEGAAWSQEYDNSNFAARLFNIAIRSCKAECVSYFQKQGLDLNGGITGPTPLQAAVETNQKDIVEFLLTHGVDNFSVCAGDKKCDLILLGCRFGGVGMAELMLAYGVPFTFPSGRAIPLEVLQNRNDAVSILEFLKQHGYDPDALLDNCLSLVFICSASSVSYDAFKWAVDNSASLDSISTAGGEEDDYLCDEETAPVNMLILHHQNEKLSYLLEHGGNNFLALEQAIRACNPEALNMLLDRGASVFDKRFQGNDLLCTAAIEGFENMVAILLDLGLSINEQNETSGYTPLICAAIANTLDAAELLLRRGADPSIKGTDGETALDLADRKGYDLFVKLLETGSIPKE